MDALLDSNVVIAAVAEAHERHAPSLAVLSHGGQSGFAVAAHSYAEAYSTLTRGGRKGLFGLSPEEAWTALESVRAVTSLVGLTAAQVFDATRQYARSGGMGARLYDKLIGQAALIHRIPAIVTWNVAHMHGLFPALTVLTPRDVARGFAPRN